MALIFFNRSTYHFYRFKLWVSASQIALTLSLLMSGSNSPDLNTLNYEVRDNNAVLIDAAMEVKNSSWV